MKHLITFLSISFCCFCINACTCTSKKETKVQVKEKQLNISILLDLSDRIDKNHPHNYQRDTLIIKEIINVFKSDFERKGTFKEKGKIKIFCSPLPKDDNINNILRALNKDCSSMQPADRKILYNSIANDFHENIKLLYESTFNTQQWIGSDIWRFFKNDVKDLCIEQDSTYKNILVILTDGYIYHKDSKDREKNRYAYLLSNNLQKYRKPNYQELIDNDDFGLITKTNDLQNLDILVLEINATDNYKNDEDILKYILEKWFKEMNVGKYEIYNTDEPTHTRTRILNFFGDKK